MEERQSVPGRRPGEQGGEVRGCFEAGAGDSAGGEPGAARGERGDVEAVVRDGGGAVPGDVGHEW